MYCIYEKLGHLIRINRKAKGYSTHELAKILNVSAGLINNIENGKNDVFKLELLTNLLHSLDMPIGEIFTEQYLQFETDTLASKQKIINLNFDNKTLDKHYDILQKAILSITESFISLALEYDCSKEAIEFLSDAILQNLEIYKRIRMLK